MWQTAHSSSTPRNPRRSKSRSRSRHNTVKSSEAGSNPRLVTRFIFPSRDVRHACCPLHLRQFGKAAQKMFLIARLGIEIGFEEVAGEPFADDLRAETADIRVVMFDALMGGVDIVTQSGADARHLVRRHARADPRPADHH